MGGFFSSSTQAPQASIVSNPYQAINQPLTSTLASQVTPQTPYSGQLVAPLDSQQDNSLNLLNQYATSSLSNNQPFQEGLSAISSLEGPNADVSTSPYYQAIKAAANQNIGLTNQSIADSNAGAGRFYSGAQAYDTGMADTSAENSLNTTLGQLALNQQQLQAQVLPEAQSYAGTEQNLPLAQTAALQTYGALPNQYQQALDTANYNEWTAANYTRPDTAIALADSLPGISPAYAYDQTNPSQFSQYLNAMGLSQAAGIANVAGGGSSTGTPETVGSSGGGASTGTGSTATTSPSNANSSNSLSTMLNSIMSLFGSGGSGAVSPAAVSAAGVPGVSTQPSASQLSSIDPSTILALLSSTGG